MCFSFSFLSLSKWKRIRWYPKAVYVLANNDYITICELLTMLVKWTLKNVFGYHCKKLISENFDVKPDKFDHSYSIIADPPGTSIISYNRLGNYNFENNSFRFVTTFYHTNTIIVFYLYLCVLRFFSANL